VRGAEVGIRAGVGVLVGGVGLEMAVGVAVGGSGLGVGVGGADVGVKVSVGSGVDVAGSDCVGSGGKVASAGRAGVLVGVATESSGWISVSTPVAVGDGSMAGKGVSVAGSEAIASADWPEAISEVAGLVSSEAVSRRVANQPPKNRAVIATQTKIERRARWALLLSSSLTIGKMAP
jgi:hypothetical protein